MKKKSKKKYTMTRSELLKEHKPLIKTLSKGTKKQRIAEAKKQAKEVKEKTGITIKVK